MVRARRLREKLTFEQPTETRDASGGPQETWATYAIRFGSIEPASGRERYIASQFESDVSHRIRVRYDRTLKNVTPKYRITHDSRTFDIDSIINVDERNKELIILVTERV